MRFGSGCELATAWIWDRRQHWDSSRRPPWADEMKIIRARMELGRIAWHIAFRSAEYCICVTKPPANGPILRNTIDKAFGYCDSGATLSRILRCTSGWQKHGNMNSITSGRHKSAPSAPLSPSLRSLSDSDSAPVLFSRGWLGCLDGKRMAQFCIPAVHHQTTG